MAMDTESWLPSSVHEKALQEEEELCRKHREESYGFWIKSIESWKAIEMSDDIKWLIFKHLDA